MTPYDLLERGLYLFPVIITPSESNPGTYNKTPAIKWRDGSSNDPAQIKMWERRFKNCAWGIDHGKSNTCALDDDSGKKPEAEQSLFALELDHGPLPSTLSYRTITGGYQHIYRGSIRNSVEKALGPGLDTRGAGGYSVAPCSPGYTVTNDAPIADTPAWLIELAGRPRERQERNAEPIGGEWDTEHGIELAISFLKRAEPARMGNGGNAHIYDIACRVREYGVSEGACKQIMLEYWYPACEPNNREETMLRVAGNAYQYAQNQPGCALPENQFDAVEEKDLKTPPRYKLLSTYDVDQFPELSWRVKGLIPSRGIFQLYGPYGSGKSFLIFDMLAAIAEGRGWFGRKTKQTSTVYVCLEGEAALKQRKNAWEKHNGRRLPENFHMIAQPWSIITKRDILDLVEVVPKGALCAIDTQNRAAPAINESASEEMGQVIEGAKTLERLIEGVVGLVAHPGKDTSRGVRGHSSQTAAMDAAIEVNRDGEIRIWKSVKVKDGTDGEEDSFKLKVIGLGYQDEDGEEVTSCVIDIEVEDPSDTNGITLGRKEAVAWQSIKMLASASRTGEVAEDDWRADVASQMSKNDDKNFKNRFYEYRDSLKKKSLVRKQNGLWVISALTPVNDEGIPF